MLISTYIRNSTRRAFAVRIASRQTTATGRVHGQIRDRETGSLQVADAHDGMEYRVKTKVSAAEDIKTTLCPPLTKTARASSHGTETDRVA